MKHKASGHQQIQAMIGSTKHVDYKVLKDPEDLGSITTIFHQMRLHYSGSWFADHETQKTLNKKVEQWRLALLPYRDDLVLRVLSEFLDAGNLTAPTLEDFLYRLGQKAGHSRKSAKSVKNRYMANIKKTTHPTQRGH